MVKWYRIVTVRLDVAGECELKEAHIPIAAYLSKDNAWEDAERYVEEYQNPPKPFLSVQAVYIDEVEVPRNLEEEDFDRMEKILSLGEPLSKEAKKSRDN